MRRCAPRCFCSSNSTRTGRLRHSWATTRAQASQAGFSVLGDSAETKASRVRSIWGNRVVVAEDEGWRAQIRLAWGIGDAETRAAVFLFEQLHANGAIARFLGNYAGAGVTSRFFGAGRFRRNESLEGAKHLGQSWCQPVEKSSWFTGAIHRSPMLTRPENPCKLCESKRRPDPPMRSATTQSSLRGIHRFAYNDSFGSERGSRSVWPATESSDAYGRDGNSDISTASLSVFDGGWNSGDRAVEADCRDKKCQRDGSAFSRTFSGEASDAGSADYRIDGADWRIAAADGSSGSRE